MICPKCFANNDDSNQICSSCGASFAGDANQATVKPQQQKKSVKEVVMPIIEKVKNSKVALIAIAAVVVIALLFGVGKMLFKKPVKTSDDITNAPAFFLKNKAGKYALFNDSGKKITDFIFDDADDFINGTAVVENEEGQDGIINTSGKMVVDFGKYESIYERSGLYSASDEEYNRYILNNTGKVIYSKENMKLTTFYSSDMFSILETDEKQIVLNYAGKEITSFKTNSEAKSATANEENDIVSVFYDGKTVIFNPVTAKVLATIEDEKHFCVNSVSEDGKTITLNSCVSMWGSQEETEYKIIRNNKLFDISKNECDRIFGYNSGRVSCFKDGGDYLLTKGNKRGIKLTGAAYIDDENYVLKNENYNKGVNFYQKGKMVKAVETITIQNTGEAKGGLYLMRNFSTLSTENAGTYDYYKANGELAFKGEFERASNFDENNFAEVSNDDKYYYLIDTKGKKITDEYEYIYYESKVYTVRKNNKQGIISRKGKVVVPCEYDKVEVRVRRGHIYAILTKGDSYEFFDVDAKKSIFTSKKKMEVDDHYFYINEDGTTKYYALNGKMFYEE